MLLPALRRVLASADSRDAETFDWTFAVRGVPRSVRLDFRGPRIPAKRSTGLSVRGFPRPTGAVRLDLGPRSRRSRPTAESGPRTRWIPTTDFRSAESRDRAEPFDWTFAVRGFPRPNGNVRVDFPSTDSTELGRRGLTSAVTPTQPSCGTSCQREHPGSGSMRS